MKIILSVVIIMVLLCFAIYNILKILKNKVLRSKSNIDVYLTQRFNLIPNLVDCVKEYTNYEKCTLEEVVRIREEYIKSKDIVLGNNLNTKINEMILQIEKYPNLKASEQYIMLEKNLVKMENQIQAARRIYNLTVLKYNNVVTIFPISIMAKILKFKEEKFFEGDIEGKHIVKF